MTLNKKCVGCDSSDLTLKSDLLICNSCKLLMSTDMRELDYPASYEENLSLYGEHLKHINRFQTTDDVLKVLLPFEKRIIELISDQPTIINGVDLGCGTGRFLRAMEHIGIDAVGFEVVPKLVGELNRYGRTVMEGAISEFITSKLAPDVITLLEVVEHLRDPADMVGALLSQKRPKLLFVAVPEHTTRRLFDANFAAHDVPPNHLTWWNHASLHKLLARHGYNARVELIPESRRSLAGHLYRNRYRPTNASLADWIGAFLRPPSFWLLGVAYQH